MIVLNEIAQGTSEWFEVRWGKIGGTRADMLIKQSDVLPIELIAEITEKFETEEDGYYSNDMLRAFELEPEARQELSKYIGQELSVAGWWQSEENNLLGISPDGFTENLDIAVEIKCPARKKHTKTILEDEIPSEHMSQCLHYFTVNLKLKELYFCSFRPESIKPLFVKKLTRDSEIDLGFKVKTKIKEDRGLGLKEYVATIADIKTVAQWVEVAKSNCKALEAEIDRKIETIKF